MKHILLVSHSTLAKNFKETAKMIAGENAVKGITTIGIDQSDSPEQFINSIVEYLSNDCDGEYLVLADLYGASPCNSTCMAMRGKKYRIVTGLNLGMLLEAIFSIQLLSLDELSIKLEQMGKEGIRTVYIPDDSTKR